MTEKQNVEYKQSWRDEYLKWVCGFANAHGGKIFIGINDDGKVKGISDYKYLMDEIPNKTVNHLGLVVDVNLHMNKGKHYIEIDVPVSTVPISYHGAYHYRSGSTKQELKGSPLHDFLLKKLGKTWDDLPVFKSSTIELDYGAINYFFQLALKSGRIASDSLKYTPLALLESLELVNEAGELKNATILLFGKNPMKYFLSSYFKIGRFGENSSDLMYQDTIEGNIFGMVDRIMDLLKGKYLTSPISYQGLLRTDTLEYPEAALREAILNAIVHRDYADNSTIQLSVYNDKLVLWNPGKLPFDITIEQLKRKHPSRLRNRNIAEIFFRAGYIESWGRGIDKMLEAFKSAGLPEPIFEELAGGVQVTFQKDIYIKGYLNDFDLEDRQVSVLLYMKEHGSITNIKYQELTEVSKRTASRDLQVLIDKHLIHKSGSTGKGTSYNLVRPISKGAKGVIKGS
jgi:ATP-dependent DNA helicase RecG